MELDMRIKERTILSNGINRMDDFLIECKAKLKITEIMEQEFQKTYIESCKKVLEMDEEKLRENIDECSESIFNGEQILSEMHQTKSFLQKKTSEFGLIKKKYLEILKEFNSDY